MIFFKVLSFYFITLPRVLEIQKVTENPLEDIGGKDTLVLNCIVKGDNISISWKFNNSDITENALTKFSKGNSQLKIEEMKLINSGRYKCVATNQYGSSFGQIDVRVHSMGSFKKGFSVEDTVLDIGGQIGKPLKIKCPPHKPGIGQVYWWGDLPVSSPPILWSNGKPSSLGFISDHEYVFAYLTEEVVQDINIIGGISCILYQSQHSIQSVKQKINVIEKDDNQNFSANLESFMAKQNYAVNNSKTYTLNCGATGRPLPEITWFKNGKIINETKPYEIRDGGMSLNIRPVTFESAGTYKCVAKNYLGSSEKEGQLIVQSHPIFSKELESSNTVTYGETLKLSCVADSFPLPYYEWYLNNTLIKSNDEFVINGGNLVVSFAKFNHTGLYLCVATNDMHNGVHTNVSAGFVLVKAVAPKILEKFPQTVYVFQNHTNNIFCNISGHPDPEFIWKHKSVVITTGGRFIVHKNGSLIIKSVEKQDSGEYTCTARNVEGNVSQQTFVKVIEKVKIFKPPMSRVFTEHTPMAQLLCDATYESSLSFKIEWYRNNEKFQQKDERVYLEKRANQLSRILYFKNISREDAATYVCKVYNMDGDKVVSTDEASASVEVIVTDFVPTDLQLNGNCTFNKTVVLSWNSRVATGTTEFIIEYSLAGTDLWRKYKIVKNTYVHLEVNTLPPSAQLLFRVTKQDNDKVFNETFVSNPSGATKELCVTPPGAPIKNPQNIRALAMSEGELKVKWDKLDLLDQPGPGFVLVVNFNKLDEGSVTIIKVDGNEEMFEVPQPGINNEFNVKVFATNDYGSNLENKEFHFKSGGKAPEGIVSNLRQLSVSHCCVDLAWDAIPSITGYRIFHKVNVQSRYRRNLAVSSWTDVNTNNVTLGSLMAATEYEITVSALNEQVAGTPCQPIVVKTSQKILEYIDMPRNGRVAIFGSVVYFTWDPPVIDPIEALTAYQVTYYKFDNPSEKINKKLNGDSTEVYIYDLEKLNYYTFEVTAVTKTRQGKPWVVKGVSVTYPDVPGQPAMPDVVVVNKTFLNITFKLPNNYEGDLPNQYHIYYIPDGSAKNPLNKTSSYPGMPWVLLDSLETVVYRIYAVGENGMGKGDKSNNTYGHPNDPDALPIKHFHPVPFYKELWFIVLVIVLIILILVCIILCCVLCNGGGKYPVNKKEKLRGGWDNEPLKDYADDQMKELNDLPLGNTEIKPPARRTSENSISKKALYSDDDKDSLDDYAEDSRFEEDGSFIGQYGDDKKNGNAVKV